MSKADSLGGSPTFDAVAQPISSRAASFARFAGQDTPPAPHTAAGDPSPRSPRVPISAIASNPFNPREELKAIEEMADSLTGRGIIQPLTVVTREAFLGAHPGQEESLGGAQYIVVDGNRRLAGATLAGLDDVPVHIDDSLADDADTLLETALTAAVQHESLDPLDEAKALQRLVQVHGSQRAVARALGKSSPWVTQRIALLKLTPELQAAVEDRSLPVEIARNVGQLPAQQQHTAATDALMKRAQSKGKRRRQDASGGANGVSTQSHETAGANAVSTPDQPQSDVQPTTGTSPEPPAAAPRPSNGIPDGTGKPVIRMPWFDGNQVADLVFAKMDTAQQAVLLKRLLEAHNAS
ncbi:ParB/RepB/Spo0J family partition protein [Streptomyces sp. NBC_00654]|uniref:ParB/RepB/Spo0J family partition protein n=1 Tax=Streptomyces sp. NBC_00654 TaxID=2975799 RepID=UPI00224C95BE|nr:ParB/RepB/Spo0J family partition protein [Streptomyces sp. NBC_00654]MCX4970777.1 ParB/RepB/Spo0J family partition protein [Streptomyces sp. NBC_00654]